MLAVRHRTSTTMKMLKMDDSLADFHKRFIPLLPLPATLYLPLFYSLIRTYHSRDDVGSICCFRLELPGLFAVINY